MRKQHFKPLAVLCAMLFIWSACENVFYGEIDPYKRQLFLYADYKNVGGTNPVLTLRPGRSSDAIKIAANGVVSSVVNPNTSRAFVNVSGITLEDELGVYGVQSDADIITEELINGEWREDSENFLYPDDNTRLDVVLVLDVSSSLDTNLQVVKGYAENFVRTFFQGGAGSSIDARIGIVGFSQDISPLAMTNNPSIAINHINSLPSGDATKLYEAIDVGLDLLENSTADGKAIVTFTDGRNNAWSDANKYQTPNVVLQRLKASDIRSYTIGFDGKDGVDRNELQELAVEGLFAFPRSISDVEKVFQRFANSVAATRIFTYERNSSELPEPIQLRFRIFATLL